MSPGVGGLCFYTGFRYGEHLSLESCILNLESFNWEEKTQYVNKQYSNFKFMQP